MKARHVGQKPEWFKMDPAKFLADAQVDAMSTLELGACIRLLCRQWMDGYLPDDLHVLGRLSRLDATAMAEAWVTLSKFFPIIEPDKRANRFMWIERERVVTDQERRSDEGLRAARKRWDEKKALNATPNGSPNGSPMPDPMQEKSREEKSREESISSEPSIPDRSPGSSETSQDEKAARWVFDLYVKILERNSKTYLYTDKRRHLILARLKEASAMRGGREAAANFLAKCIVVMTESDWHMGRDPKTEGKTYNELENVFASTKFQQWVTAVEKAEQDAPDDGEVAAFQRSQGEAGRPQ